MIKSPYLVAVLLIIGVGFSSWPALAERQEESQSKGESQGSITAKTVPIDGIFTIPRGSARTIETSSKFKRASIANPDVADEIVISPNRIYLVGKSLGVTTLTLWNKDGDVGSSYNIIVVQEVSADSLMSLIKELFPEEKQVTIFDANGHILLRGHVSTLEIKEKMGELAGVFAPQKVINWLKYGP